MNQDGREVHTWQVAAASVLTQLPNVFSAAIRQQRRTEHRLTIGAPRRPVMSGRGLRLCRSMMQGQVNVSGAK